MRRRKLSVRGAGEDYGVATGTPEQPEADLAAAETLRAERRDQRGQESFFDRGPGYARLAAARRTRRTTGWTAPPLTKPPPAPPFASCHPDA